MGQGMGPGAMGRAEEAEWLTGLNPFKSQLKELCDHGAQQPWVYGGHGVEEHGQDMGPEPWAGWGREERRGAEGGRREVS